MIALLAPADTTSATAWRTQLQRVLAAHARRLSAIEILVGTASVGSGALSADAATFALRVAASEVRAIDDRIRIVLGGPATTDEPRLRELYTTDVAPYVDVLDIGAARIRSGRGGCSTPSIRPRGSSPAALR